LHGGEGDAFDKLPEKSRGERKDKLVLGDGWYGKKKQKTTLARCRSEQKFRGEISPSGELGAFRSGGKMRTTEVLQG